MIIDCHTHIFPDEVRKDRESFTRSDEGFASLYRGVGSRMVGAEELVASMDEAGIERSVICGFPWKDPDCCFLHNQYLLESASRYPGRFIVFISLLFSKPDWSAEEMYRGIKNGAKGVGEVAFYHQGMTCQDIEVMNPVLSEMAKEMIPILLHTNEHVGHPYPGKGDTPLEVFYRFVLSFPTLPVILAHWGGGLPFYELMPEVAKAMANVYYDTAASPLLYSKRIYAVVSGIVGSEKILFGSDYPLIHPRKYFRELEESGLSHEDQQKILGLNFSRAFRV